jgi:hypothetical protein
VDRQGIIPKSLIPQFLNLKYSYHDSKGNIKKGKADTDTLKPSG